MWDRWCGKGEGKWYWMSTCRHFSADSFRPRSYPGDFYGWRNFYSAIEAMWLRTITRLKSLLCHCVTWGKALQLCVCSSEIEQHLLCRVFVRLRWNTCVRCHWQCLARDQHSINQDVTHSLLFCRLSLFKRKFVVLVAFNNIQSCDYRLSKVSNNCNFDKHDYFSLSWSTWKLIQVLLKMFGLTIINF